MLRARIRAWLSRTLTPDDGRRAGAAGDGASVARDGVPIAEHFIETLRAMPLFRALSAEQMRSLVREAVDQVYEPGYAIVRDGAPSSTVFVILSGRARVTEMSRETHAEIVLTELGPGEILGELGILRNQPRVGTVVALERTHCLVLRPARFLEALEQVPGFALGLVQVLASRLTDTDRKLARYAPDPLTGLLTRRAFVEQYARLSAGARRRCSGVLVMVVDVVELRSINDREGYGVGDEVLKAVADGLREVTRATDLVARLGGDDFAVLLIDAEPPDVDRLIERIQARLAAPRRQLPVHVKCSVGATFIAVPPDAPDELLRAADDDMRRRHTGS